MNHTCISISQTLRRISVVPMQHILQYNYLLSFLTGHMKMRDCPSNQGILDH